MLFLGGIASSAISSAMQASANKKAAKKSYKYKKQWALEGPALVRAGLERAGINPIFAAGGIAGGATSATPTVQGVGMTDPGGTGSKMLKAWDEKQLIKQQLETSSATAAKESQLANKAGIERTLLEQQMPVASAHAAYARTPLGRSTIQAAEHMRHATAAAPTFGAAAGSGVGLITTLGKYVAEHGQEAIEEGRQLYQKQTKERNRAKNKQKRVNQQTK